MVTTFRTVSNGSAGPKGAVMDEVQRNVEHLFETQTVMEIREACTLAVAVPTSLRCAF